MIARLFWGMLIGSVVIWVGVMGLAFYASRAEPHEGRQRQGHRLILAGALTPAVVLFGLLVYGLALLPAMTRPGEPGNLRISVAGEQWWWRVRYEPPGQQAVELANEIRLPVNQPVEFRLRSSNVIHSFWIPSLGGKMDMIPGRENRLVLRPTAVGTYRGVCAEFCGRGHAHMAFRVVVMPAADFRDWLANQNRPVDGAL